MSLNIGLDLCDDYIIAYEYEDQSMINVPAVICREKKDDLWYIGEGAYRMALSGKGVLTDKLLSLLRSHERHIRRSSCFPVCLPPFSGSF